MPKVRAPVHILQHLWFHWRRTRRRASGGAAETCAAAAWVCALGHSTPFLALLPAAGWGVPRSGGLPGVCVPAAAKQVLGQARFPPRCSSRPWLLLTSASITTAAAS